MEAAAECAPHFPPTRWSIVLTAAGGGAPARAALEELCRLYWFPLYAFARQRGWSPEDAEDATQTFLVRVAEGKLLAAATRERGRLRTWLLTAFQHDLMDERRRRDRLKRGANYQFVPMEILEAESRLIRTATLESPSAVFDRAWALTCLEAAAAALEKEYGGRGRGALFDALRPFLDPAGEVSSGSAMQATGLDANALRQAVFRLRQRFRTLLRQHIADTLDQPTESLIDEELAALRAALAD